MTARRYRVERCRCHEDYGGIFPCCFWRVVRLWDRAVVLALSHREALDYALREVERDRQTQEVPC